MGDIGTHCHQLAEYVTGLEVEAVCADLTTFVPGRALDDDGNVLLRLSGDARGLLHASQVSVGEENGLRLRVYGERGTLDWRQEEPNTLLLRWPNRPAEIQRTAGPSVSDAARRATRLPMGHPEGFIEAFANLYRDFALALDARRRGDTIDRDVLDFPGAADGVRGMRFLEAVVASSRSRGWVTIERDRIDRRSVDGGAIDRGAVETGGPTPRTAVQR
jgi:predicted dehydrogenase